MKKERILYLECNSGISGDMTVGALLDLGASRKALEETLESLGIGGYHLHFGRKKKCGIDAFDFDVHLEENGDGHHHEHDHSHGHVCENHDRHEHVHAHEHHDGHEHSHPHIHRELSDILAIIRRMDGEQEVKDLAAKIFYIVAEAESKAHGIPVEEVHFHEVGAIDSIVDIISTAVCVRNLNIDKIIVSPLAEGQGYVRCQHGVMPVPVPATANIAAAWNLKMKFTDNEGEMVTPTGAAIAAALHCGESLPQYYQIEKIGIGAGNKDFKNANILRAMVITAEKPDTGTKEVPAKPAGNTFGRIDEGVDCQALKGLDSDTMVKLEANLDDCTGEALGFAMEELLAAGAADVWYTPIFMKKNRPAYLLSVLCKEPVRNRLEEIIFTHTTTIGIRRTVMERTILKRNCTEIETELGKAKVKICQRGQSQAAYPEYESVKEIARTRNLPFTEVYHQIKEAASDKKKDNSLAAAWRECSNGSKELTENILLPIRARLEQEMEKYAGEDVAVAFSGGVDSSLLLKLACEAAKKTGTRVYGVTFDTRLHPACDLEIAKQVAKELGAEHVILTIDELEQAEIGKNPKDRCYLCKRSLFMHLQEFAKGRGISRILEGTNQDDLHVYRPGIRAVKELGIISPLAELGITKTQVKALASFYRISVAARPSTPCMATRLPYGAELDYEILEKIEQGEAWLRERLDGNVRLRIHGQIARIEVDKESFQTVMDLKDAVTGVLKDLGFPYVTLDLEGFRSGSMDLV